MARAHDQYTVLAKRLKNVVMWGLKSGPLGLLKKYENAQRIVSWAS